MAGFLAAAGLIGGAASAAGHGLADSHKRAGDVGGADVIFQTATADAGVVLVQFPDLSLPAVCGIGSMLGIAGYQVIEIAIQRRFKGRGKP